MTLPNHEDGPPNVPAREVYAVPLLVNSRVTAKVDEEASDLLTGGKVVTRLTFEPQSSITQTEPVLAAVFLCRACSVGGEEKGKTPLVESKACEYCGALCSNMPWFHATLPNPNPFPPGAFITRATAPSPRALSRLEFEAQVRPPPEPRVETPNPFLAPESERCGGSATSCGGSCGLAKLHVGACVCNPDSQTGEETCPA